MVFKALTSLPSGKIKYGLERTEQMLESCKAKNNQFLKIQIIGTNGKGSVSAFLSNILCDAGLKVGLYTSPHLLKINERIQINRKEIKNASINKFLLQHSKEIDVIKPTFFEIMTTMAIWYFKIKKVDVAILETGLGGRLDSVTACKSDILLFTAISMDHHNILGNSLEKITKEKAGAIQNSKQLCLSVYQNKKIRKILKSQASSHNNKITFLAKNVKNNKQKIQYLYGRHQKENANLAKQSIRLINKQIKIKFKTKQITKSINNTRWQGRFQIIQSNPLVIYDVAHNNKSLKVFLENFKNYQKKLKHKSKHLICAFENNKRISTIFKKYEVVFDYIICTEAQVRLSMPADTIANIFSKRNKVQKIKKADKAILFTLKNAKKSDIVVIIGSHYLAPAINKNFKNCFALKE